MGSHLFPSRRFTCKSGACWMLECKFRVKFSFSLIILVMPLNISYQICRTVACEMLESKFCCKHSGCLWWYIYTIECLKKSTWELLSKKKKKNQLGIWPPSRKFAAMSWTCIMKQKSDEEGWDLNWESGITENRV